VISAHADLHGRDRRFAERTKSGPAAGATACNSMTIWMTGGV
jgi:hypothetical protein